MVLVLQCDPACPAGVIDELLAESGLPAATLRLYEPVSLPESGYSAVLLLGGAMGVGDEDAHPFLVPLKAWLRRTARAGVPLLGICLGGQLLAAVLGGACHSRSHGEKGLTPLALTAAGYDDPLFAGFAQLPAFFQWHNDSFTLPPGGTLLASSASCPEQAFRYVNAWGVQFHPEVTAAIVDDWCKLEPDPNPAAAFRAVAAQHAIAGQRLIANFLHTTGVLTRAPKESPDDDRPDRR